MRRRALLAGLGATAAAGRLRAEPARPRLAWVHPSAPLADLRLDGPVRAYRAFLEELRRLGRVDGESLRVERYSAMGRLDRYAAVAAAAVEVRPDVIFASGAELTRHIAAATRTIPIVAILSNPLETGLVATLAHPGGNVTGASVDAGLEIWSKRLALLKEALPGIVRVGFLCSRPNWDIPGREGEAARAAAAQLGMTLSSAIVEGMAQEAEYRSVFAAMARERIDAVLVSDEAERFSWRELIVGLARDAGLPGLYPYREYAEIGGLMAFAVDLADAFRRGAEQVDRILSGAMPADLPFHQQAKFELIVNLSTARALKRELASVTLGRADAVIE